MKKNRKKLQLNRETLTNLNNDELKQVAGGVVSGSDSGCATGCDKNSFPNPTASNGCTFFCPTGPASGAGGGHLPE